MLAMLTRLSRVGTPLPAAFPWLAQPPSRVLTQLTGLFPQPMDVGPVDRRSVIKRVANALAFQQDELVSGLLFVRQHFAFSLPGPAL